jgi:hypothetical protein
MTVDEAEEHEPEVDVPRCGSALSLQHYMMPALRAEH